MAIDRKKLFAIVPFGPFKDRPTPEQVRAISAVLDAWDASKLTDLRWLAYMLATIRVECGPNMLPVREGFQPTDAEARQYVRDHHREYAVEVKGQVYYGRGLVQLTWEENYEIMSKLLRIDLVKEPDLALRPDIAAQIMIQGMTAGKFDKKHASKLSDFFNDHTTDWRHARQIINLMNKADEIAAYGKAFHSDVVVASSLNVAPVA